MSSVNKLDGWEEWQGGCYMPENEAEKHLRIKGIIKREQYRTNRETENILNNREQE